MLTQIAIQVAVFAPVIFFNAWRVERRERDRCLKACQHHWPDKIAGEIADAIREGRS